MVRRLPFVPLSILVLLLYSQSAVAQTSGGISGKITDATGTTGLSGLTVDIWDTAGKWVTWGNSDSTGAYAVTGLAAGDYYVSTYNSSGYIDEIYNNHACATCAVTTGDKVSVVAGITKTGVDFSLDVGGKITGTVASGTTALAGVSVYAYDSSGNWVASGNTGTDGTYTISGLPAGTYYLKTYNSAGYIDEVYLDVCGTCSVTTGTAITVALGGTKPGIDFNLAIGGSISGTIASGTTKLSSVSVVAYDSAGQWVRSTSTDTNGAYSIKGLNAGNYFVKTANTSGYLDEVYNDHVCTGCSVKTLGDAVAVSVATDIPNINFDLARGGTIAGTVTGTGGAALASAWVNIYDSNGTYVTYAYTNSSGAYSTSGLVSGTYYAKARAGGNYLPQLYSGKTCLYCDVKSEGTPISVTAPNTTTIDFALITGARISGKLTAGGTSSGLSSAYVYVYVVTATGADWVTSASTDSSGNYQSNALPPGTYRLRTWAAGYIDQSVDVTIGSTDVTQNFALTLGGSISGAVKDGTGAGLSGIDVYVYTQTGAWVSSTTSSSTGAYTVSGLATGTYVASASGGKYVGQLYNGKVCIWCDVTVGTPISVTEGATTPNIDFTLSEGGKITGTVKNEAGVGIANADVSILNENGWSVGWATTDSSGAYSAAGLLTGNYYVRVGSTGNYIGELYDGAGGIPAIGWRIEGGKTVPIKLGQTVTGIDFVLSTGGSISGTVMSGTTPLRNVWVYAQNEAGESGSGAQTDAAGAYTIGGLPSGKYTVKTSNNAGYIDELYDNVPCLSCWDTTGAKQVSVTIGSAQTGVNFNLDAGGRISGKVTDSSNNPIAWMGISVYNAKGDYAGWASTGNDGVYTTSGGLPAGTYYVRTSSYGNYIDEAFDNVACVGCSGTTGTPVAVKLGETTPNVNFSLLEGGAITGTVTVAGTTSPIAGVQIAVNTAAGKWVRGSTTDSSGVYTVRGLQTGSYLVRADAGSQGYINEAYNDIICAFCSQTTGTPVSVTAGATTRSIDFGLSAGATITGLVTSEATGAAIKNVYVNLFTATGTGVGGEDTNTEGVYTIKGLLPGTYYLRTWNSAGYIDEMYGGSTCETCSVTESTSVTVTAGSSATGVNFALGVGGAIEGKVTNAAGLAIPGVYVTAYTTAGSWVGNVMTNADGLYRLGGLKAGNYTIRTNNSKGYIDEVYDNVVCLSCSITGGNPVPVSVGATTSGINFSLGTGARISGKVTDASGNGLGDVTVDVYGSNGIWLAYGRTNQAGDYVTGGGLPPGSYRAKTENDLGYVNVLYKDVMCAGCDPVPGAAIDITGSADVTGVNFTLSLGGSLSGTVTAGGAAIESGVMVEVYDSKGKSAGYGYLTGGTYAVRGLPSGTYYARTYNWIGYIDQLYSGATCAGCSVTGGTPITVTVGSETKDINFALTQGGSITGTVTIAGSTTPIENVSVSIWSGDGRWVAGASTSSLGTYTAGGLPTGTYYASTWNQGGYIDQVYSGIACTWCNALGGTKIEVTVGQSTTGVNFSLSQGGSISGKITNTNKEALANVGVYVYITSGGTQGGGYATTNSSGEYTVKGLASGIYAAQTYNSAGYIDEQYDDIVCLGCYARAGKPINVTAGSPTTGINFELSPGARISGTILDGSDKTPVSGWKNCTADACGNIQVNFYTITGDWVTSASPDALGVYITPMGLPAGTYYARTENNLGYIDLTYAADACLDCGFKNATSITVATGETKTGIDFNLSRGAQIRGVVKAADTGSPIPWAGVSVFTESGHYVGGGWANYDGTYATQGLPPGTYYLHTNNSFGYIDQLYNGIECIYCPASSGTKIVISGSDVTGIDFSLVKGGRISGTVTNAAGGAGIPSVSVWIYNSSGNYVAGGYSDATGHYESYTGLPAGTYYARTSNDAGFTDKLYNGYKCFECTVTTGTPIAVAVGATTTGVDFALTAGGRISGLVTRASNGAPVPNVWIQVFSSTGEYITYAASDTAGKYISASGLPTGTYYLRAWNNQGLINVLYHVPDNLTCATCPPLSGTGISVTDGVTTENINFVLQDGGLVSGRVTDASTGLPLSKVWITVFDPTGTGGSWAYTDLLGYYRTDSGLPTGTYRVRTSNSDGYIDEAYDDQVCVGVNCPADAGTPVALVAGTVTANINFALARGSGVSGTVIDKVTKQAIWGASVELWDSGRVLLATGTTDQAGRYTVTAGLPAGNYFVRTRNGQGYVDEVYNTGVCLACDVTRGTAVAVDGSTTTSGIDFQLGLGGRIHGTVTASDTGAALAGVKIRFFNSAGSHVGTRWTNGLGEYTSPGLPAGSYYVRTTTPSGYVDELYDNAKCTPCTIATGTPVVVTTGNTVNKIDFALDTGGLVSGTITDATTGSPIVGVTVSVYKVLADNSTSYVATTEPTDKNGYYSISLPEGQYTVQPNPFDGYTPLLKSSLRSGGGASRTITVDRGGEVPDMSFLMSSCQDITVSPTSLSVATKGQSYSQTISASGGTSPYTFSISSGELPSGMTLSSSGSLSGTPSAGGTANFTIAAVDAGSCAGTRDYAFFACSTSLSTSTLSTAAAAGTGSVSVIATSSDCPWSASSGASWITITSASSGTGSGTVSFSVAANTNTAARSGTLSIGGQTYTVTQGGLTVSAPFGTVDTPVNGLTGVSGSLAVTGWALDDLQVTRVTVYREAVSGEAAGTQIYIGNAVFVEGARPDLETIYPGYPYNKRGGWGYLLLTNMLPNQGNGTYTLHMYAEDGDQSRVELGSRTFTAANTTATVPFGAIDTPGQGATISGASYVNFGWALTPLPKSIATDGSGISVYIDGVRVGTVTYNNYRGDVAGLFPGLNNTDGAIGYRYIDTTAYTNGVHTISWVATDSAGAATGIGSRYFTINNTLASLSAAPRPAVSASAQSQPLSSGVWSTTGWSSDSFAALAVDGGTRRVTVGQLGRLELRLVDTSCTPSVSGALIVNGERRPLPVGSMLSPDGVFTWQPGPAFLGTYDLLFEVAGCTGTPTTVPVKVTVTSK